MTGLRIPLSRPVDWTAFAAELERAGAILLDRAVDHVDVLVHESVEVDAREIAAVHCGRGEPIVLERAPSGHRRCALHMFDVRVANDDGGTTVRTHVFVVCECRLRFRSLVDLQLHHKEQR